MLAASTAGTTYGDVLQVCDRAYAAAGHPQAWREHYQGGPIGYRQREFEIAPLAGCDEPVRARAHRGRPRARVESQRARRRQVRGHVPRRARGTRADHRHRRAGRCSRMAGRRCSTSRAERRRRSQREGPELARAPRTAATGDGRRKRVALSRRRRVPHRDPERRGPARARRGHRRPRRASGSR